MNRGVDMENTHSLELSNHLGSTGLPPRIVNREYNESLFFTEIKGHLEAAKGHLLESGFLLENIHLRHDGWDSFFLKCESYGIDRKSVGLAMVVATDHGGLQLDIESGTSKPRQIGTTLSIETGQIDFFLEGKFAEATQTSRELANHNRRLRNENKALDVKLQLEKNQLDLANKDIAKLESEALSYLAELNGRAEWEPDGVGEANLQSDIMALCDKAVLFRNQIRSKLAHLHEDAPPRLIGAIECLLSYIESTISTATAEVRARIGQIDPGEVSRFADDAEYQEDEIHLALNVVEDKPQNPNTPAPPHDDDEDEDDDKPAFEIESDVPVQLTDTPMINNMTAHVNDLPKRGKRKDS
jgi:hypothetical protein